MLFAEYSDKIDKTVMFEEIRNSFSGHSDMQRLNAEERKLIIDELRRVELLYTFDTKTIQKVMWQFLESVTGQKFEVTSFKKENYHEIAGKLD